MIPMSVSMCAIKAAINKGVTPDIREIVGYERLDPKITFIFCRVCRNLVQDKSTGLILGLRPANERRRYSVTTSLSPASTLSCAVLKRPHLL